MSLPDGRVSFDVFDTALVRTVARPEGIFERVARRLQEEGQASLARRFVGARRRALVKAWLRRRREEITLDEIYAQLGLGLPPGELRRLQSLELELEFASVRPVAEVAAMTAELRAQGRQVVFISDTYFETAFVRKLLEQVGIWHDQDRLYASSESGFTKRHGTLFDYVSQREGVAGAEWTHFGDNWWADVVQARRRGWRARLWRATRPTVMERQLKDTEMIGFSRAIRLARLFEDPAEAAYRRAAAGLAAPLLVNYVAWVLNQAGQRGLQRLFFLSRDGRILNQIAERLVARTGQQIELGYLHGSRQSWFRAAAGELSRVDREWLTETRHHLTLTMFGERAGLDPVRVADELQRVSGRLWPIDEPLGDRGLAQFEELFDQSLLPQWVREASDAERSKLLGYLRQRGVVQPKVGLVDVGWLGRMARALGRTLGDEARPEWFYVALIASPASENTDFTAHGYLFDTSAGYRRSHFLFSLMVELFTQSRDEGRTTGYHLDDEGSWQPTLTESSPYQAGALAEEVMRQAILDWVDELSVRDAHWLLQTAERRAPALLRSIYRLMNRPTLAEAEHLGSLPADIDSADRDLFGTLGPRLQLSDSLRFLAYSLNSRHWPKLPAISSWPEASCRRSSLLASFPLRVFLKIANQVDNLTPYIIRWLQKREKS